MNFENRIEKEAGRVARINVTRSSMPPMEEYFEEVAPLWKSHWLTNAGEKHRELEWALVERLKVGNVSLFSNGHSALECAIEALGLGSDGRDEVVTTPYTFASTTNAIFRKGLRPVFADVRQEDCTLDPERVEAAITPRTCAIVPVHVYGSLCDVDAIQEIADRHGLAVLYDAAHAFGVERLDPASGEWRGAASYGDASMLSFHATKVFNTIEGGAVCCADSTLKSVMEEWRNFGLEAPEADAHPGGNAKMNEFCAAMGLCNLRHLDGELAKRAAVEARYREGLGGVSGLRLLEPQEGIRPNHAYMPVFFEEAFGADRDEVMTVLAERGIGARRYFFPCTNESPWVGRAGIDPGDTPVAHGLSREVLTLPQYADLALEDVDMICEIVRGCAR